MPKNFDLGGVIAVKLWVIEVTGRGFGLSVSDKPKTLYPQNPKAIQKDSWLLRAYDLVSVLFPRPGKGSSKTLNPKPITALEAQRILLEVPFSRDPLEALDWGGLRMLFFTATAGYGLLQAGDPKPSILNRRLGFEVWTPLPELTVLSWLTCLAGGIGVADLGLGSEACISFCVRICSHCRFSTMCSQNSSPNPKP